MWALSASVCRQWEPRSDSSDGYPFYNSVARLYCDPLSRKATLSATQGAGTRRASGELRIDASFHQKWDPFRLGTGSFFHRYLVVEALSRLCNCRLVEATMPPAGWLGLMREPSHGSFLRYPRTPEPFRPQR